MGEILLLVLPGIVFFALQFFILRKTENRLIRLIPVGLLVLLIAIVAVLFAMGTRDVGHAWHGFLGLLGMGVLASSLIGEVLVWIINWGW